MNGSAEHPSQRSGPIGRWLSVLAAGLGLSLTTALVSGLALGLYYTPRAAAPDLPEVPGYQLSRALGALHGLALYSSLLLAIVWAMICVLFRRSSTGRRALLITSAAVTVVATIIASLTWLLVQWDQVALWAVTVGYGYRGLMRPAFSDEVRFLIIGGAEVAPVTYRAWVLLHLAAPVIALVALATGWSKVKSRSDVADQRGTSTYADPPGNAHVR